MSMKITRRELLAGAGASAAALLLEPTNLQAQQPAADRADRLQQYHRRQPGRGPA